MNVLMVSSQYPTVDRPGSGAMVVRQANALRREGVQVELLPFQGAASVANYWRGWRKLRERLRTGAFDLIHAQFGSSLLICRLQSTLPVVATFRGSDLMGTVGCSGRYTTKGKLLVALSRFASRYVDEVIVVSDRLGQRLPRRDYHVIPSGLDLDLFAPVARDDARKQLGWPAERRMVLFVTVGLDHRAKRKELAEQAISRVRREMPVELRVLTTVPREQMPLYLSAADALLLTSLHEGSPNVVKEALACNLPVVTVDVGDVRDRLSGVRHGHVCDANADALAAALRDVLDHRSRSDGRRHVADLAEPLLARRVIEVYRRVVGIPPEPLGP